VNKEELQDHIAAVLEEVDGGDYMEVAKILVDQVIENWPASPSVIFQNNGLGNVGTHIQADTINHLEL